jgi:hypothetical protein
MNETENQIRLRRAKEALANWREVEAEARRALTEAMESTKRAKEKYEELFANEEKAEVERRKADYRHVTN